MLPVMLALVVLELRMPVTCWPVVETEELAALRLFAVVVLPTVLPVMVFAPAVTEMPMSEAETPMAEPFTVMEPMLLLAIATVPLLAEPMPETGAAASRARDRDGTRSRAAADGVARHRADVDIARRDINPAPHAGQRAGVAGYRPDDVRDGIPLHTARRGAADSEPDALEQIRQKAGRRPLLSRHCRAGRITANEVAGNGEVIARRVVDEDGGDGLRDRGACGGLVKAVAGNRPVGAAAGEKHAA